MEPAARHSAAAASPPRWSFLSSASSQRCHGPRSGRGARRRKPAPGGARRGGGEMPEAVPRLPGRVSGLRGLAGRAGPGRAEAGPRVLGKGWGPARPESKASSTPFPAAVLPCVILCFFLFAFLRRGFELRVCKDDFELVILLPPLSLCRDDRRAPPCLVDAMLGMKGSPSCFISGLTAQPREARV